MYKSWKELLDEIWNTPDNALLKIKLQQEKKKYIIFPGNKDIFNAFKYCKFNNIKVIILGQEPYCEINIADGLSFSTKQNKTPLNLKIIFKEIQRTESYATFPNNNLINWANQGVLLLNTALTIRKNEPTSHIKLWQSFTLKIIRHIAARKEPIVWMLWGDHCKQYKKFINQVNKFHLILESTHPLTENQTTNQFIGNNHFQLCNEFLKKNCSFPNNININWGTDLLPF